MPEEHPMRRESDMSDAPSTWEIARGLRELRDDTRAGFKEVHAAIDKLDYVPMLLYISERDRQDKRIEAIEDDKKWNHRLVMGAIITAVASLVVTFISAQGGL